MFNSFSRTRSSRRREFAAGGLSLCSGHGTCLWLDRRRSSRSGGESAGGDALSMDRLLCRSQRRCRQRGTNFSSSVGPGTHLLGDDPVVVAGSGAGAANEVDPLAGGQVGCNWQASTLVLGLEGDFDYFHSKPGFSNNTNTLSDGVTPFTISPTLTTNYLATIRPRIGIGGGSQPSLHHGRRRLHAGQLHAELQRWCRATGRRNGERFQKFRRMDRRRGLGIRLCRPLDGESRISDSRLSQDQRGSVRSPTPPAAQTR